ncbi:hypothetical protein L209DRAFT_53323 [Thermothelomyces heterothallicus CBS 203.75]
MAVFRFSRRRVNGSEKKIPGKKHSEEKGEEKSQNRPATRLNPKKGKVNNQEMADPAEPL